MKNWFMWLFILTGISSTAQNDSAVLHSPRLTAGVLNIDARLSEFDPVSTGNLVRLELEKLAVFDVIDRYDIADITAESKFSLNNCYGKNCVIKAGELLHADRMITGSVEKMSDHIVVTLRLIHVSEKRMENQSVIEYLYLPERLQSMIQLSLRDVLKLTIDTELLKKLTVKASFESAENNPSYDRLRLDGPRFGFTLLNGEMANIFSRPEEEGGFNGYPALFNFGYQFEVQYLNEGRFQGLFEFIPTISGLDQGRFIPSFSVLHGMRDNKHGWELAFGPVVYGTPMAKGYFDYDVWHLQSDWTDTLANPHTLVWRVDSRGEIKLTSGFMVGFGRTFRSGKLNMPVNLFAVSSPYGLRYGFSMGFNVRSTGERKKYR